LPADFCRRLIGAIRRKTKLPTDEFIDIPAPFGLRCMLSGSARPTIQSGGSL